jgi:S1-C subfamily serine protease
MADAQERGGLGRPAIVAIGFAVVALLTSVVAVIVVMRRDAPAASEEPMTKRVAAPLDRTLEASELAKLKRDVVDKVTDDKGAVIGVRVKDEAVRAALGLERDDVITAINGRTIKREFDVYDAVLGMSMMDASVAYVELMRDDAPVLARWKLDGDLRAARRDSVRRTPYASTTNPFSSARDPLVDTIRKIDRLHYAVPRATIERFVANADTYARQARFVPSAVHAGYRIFVIAPGSPWATIGLQSGDTIVRVNGLHPDRYTELKDATELEIEVRRRMGIDETLRIDIQ